MRYRSWSTEGVTVYAVAGVGTVSFGVSVSKAARRGLLGFAVQRLAPGGRWRYVTGFKVFRSLEPTPEPGAAHSTRRHPIQSLVWDDFTLQPDTTYGYRFIPVRGTPAEPRYGRPAEIVVRSEPLVGSGHTVVFNRGVASSQAYQRRFGGLKPDDQPTAARRQLALDWLSRDLDEALIDVIRSTVAGDALRGAFYEFGYAPVLAELKLAVERRVDVRLIVDGKVNEHWENVRQPDGSLKRVFVRSSPRLPNLEAIDAAGLPRGVVKLREARRSDIQHNKFLVVTRSGTPAEVWTGSTNLTMGGIHGQSNVGHLVRDPGLAARFLDYWTLLATDPGGRHGQPRATVTKRNADFKAAVAALTPVPVGRAGIPPGVSVIFSPRPDAAALDLYAALLTTPQRLACATFAFGIGKQLKDVLSQGDEQNPLRFFLLERRRGASGDDPTVELNASKNIYLAWGSEIDTPLGQWVVETTTRELGLNRHVAFIHDKFLLADPLGTDPIVVTGSANFSTASCVDNDENMVLVRGDLRVADIYITEFNRLFQHYYFRSVVERVSRGDRRSAPDPTALDLIEDDSWLAKYEPGSLRAQRAAMYTTMARAERSGPRP